MCALKYTIFNFAVAQKMRKDTVLLQKMKQFTLLHVPLCCQCTHGCARVSSEGRLPQSVEKKTTSAPKAIYKDQKSMTARMHLSKNCALTLKTGILEANRLKNPQMPYLVTYTSLLRVFAQCCFWDNR